MGNFPSFSFFLILPGFQIKGQILIEPIQSNNVLTLGRVLILDLGVYYLCGCNPWKFHFPGLWFYRATFKNINKYIDKIFRDKKKNDLKFRSLLRFFFFFYTQAYKFQTVERSAWNIFPFTFYSFKMPQIRIFLVFCQNIFPTAALLDFSMFFFLLVL